MSKYEGHPSTRGDVTIGNDVWIGTEAVVLSGVSIGDGSVIGARSVVVKDVAPYSIVSGNPARYIRHRFEDEITRRLSAIQWWNWKEQKISLAMEDLLSNNIERFLSNAEAGLYDQ